MLAVLVGGLLVFQKDQRQGGGAGSEKVAAGEKGSGGKATSASGKASPSGGADRDRATGANGNRKPSPSFVGLDASGRITTGSIRALALTDPEVDALTAEISSFRNLVAEEFVSRTRLVESRVGGDNYHYTYFTQSREDRGKELLDEMRGKVEPLLGDERGGQFAASIGKSEISGSIGKYDVETSITRENGNVVVRQKYLNAKTGALVRTMEESGREFRERFGELFEIPGGEGR